MKIQYEDYWGQSRETSISEALECDEYSNCGGQLEYAQEQAKKARECLGRLCEVLQVKGLLQAHEILDIAGISHKDARLIAEE